MVADWQALAFYLPGVASSLAKQTYAATGGVPRASAAAGSGSGSKATALAVAGLVEIVSITLSDAVHVPLGSHLSSADPLQPVSGGRKCMVGGSRGLHVARSGFLLLLAAQPTLLPGKSLPPWSFQQQIIHWTAARLPNVCVQLI